jgi:von Willebrand factor type A domain
VLPLWAWLHVRRRARRVRGSLRLRKPPRHADALVAAAIVVLAGLVGVASAQPVLLDSQPRTIRLDAEAYFVMDITRSMLASARQDTPTRLERARRAARRIRAAVPDVPVGVASFTNRVVPHIFPTSNQALFASGLERSIEIERPPPDGGSGALLTAFDALAPLQTHNFFSPAATRRVAVVFTDGETRPVAQATIRALRAEPDLELIVVRFWSVRERIFRQEIPLDADYAPDPASTSVLRSFVEAVDASLFSEDDVPAAAQELRRLLGRGDRIAAGREVSARPLTAYAVALALVPLAYLFWRRNL